jgi:ubiquinone/menaquinone biosynthesis C-methylase UbiE
MTDGDRVFAKSAEAAMTLTVKELARQLCPPLLWHGAATLRRRATSHGGPAVEPEKGRSPAEQDLAIYWDAQWAEVLEHWGEGNAWNEIQLLLANCAGSVLDVACGTGKVMEILAAYGALEVTGCDISDLLIGKARGRGIGAERLAVGDATNMQFPDGRFDYAYSIGSLEHFTEDGIAKVIGECWRVAKQSSFHMVPIARDGRDHGWIKTSQSYFNNTVDWWLAKFHERYHTVHVLDSRWDDAISIGKWFVCMKSPSKIGGSAQGSC